jgi:hypothetical protein
MLRDKKDYKYEIFKIIFSISIILLTYYVNDKKTCKDTIRGRECTYTGPIFGLSDSTLQLLWLPAAVIISIITVKLMRKTKIEEETHKLLDTTLEIADDLSENKDVTSKFSYNNINYQHVKVNKNRKLDFLIWTTIIIIAILSIPYQLYLLIPIIPIVYILTKVTRDIYKNKMTISKNNQNQTIEENIPKVIKFELSILLNVHDIITKAWKYKTFKLAISSIWLTFFITIAIFTYLIIYDK